MTKASSGLSATAKLLVSSYLPLCKCNPQSRYCDHSMCTSVSTQDNSRTRWWMSTKLGRHGQRWPSKYGKNLMLI